MEIAGSVRPVREQFIQTIGRTAEIWGMHSTFGRLYGVLYFSDDPMSLEEIADVLRISKPAVSVNIKTLLAVGWVRKVWKPGDRRHYYIAEKDFSRILLTMFDQNVREHVRMVVNGAKEARIQYQQLEENADSETRELAKKDLRRVESLERFYISFAGLVERMVRETMDRLKATTEESGYE